MLFDPLLMSELSLVTTASRQIVKMNNPEKALTPLLSLGGPLKCGFFFLIRLAWDSHTRIPMLIAIIFMVFDIRMQLEINVDVALRRLPRQVGENEEEDDEGEVDDDVMGSEVDDDDDDDDDSEYNISSDETGD